MSRNIVYKTLSLLFWRLWKYGNFAKPSFRHLDIVITTIFTSYSMGHHSSELRTQICLWHLNQTVISSAWLTQTGGCEISDQSCSCQNGHCSVLALTRAGRNSKLSNHIYLYQYFQYDSHAKQQSGQTHTCLYFSVIRFGGSGFVPTRKPCNRHSWSVSTWCVLQFAKSG